MKQAGRQAARRRRSRPSICRATARSAWRSPSSRRSAASRWSGTSGGWRSSASSACWSPRSCHGWIIDRESSVPASEIAAQRNGRRRHEPGGHVTAPASEGDVPISERGPAPIEVVAGFGFWLFLLSDIVMFSALFAAYAVLADRTPADPMD
jgi:hypothetical protein